MKKKNNKSIILNFRVDEDTTKKLKKVLSKNKKLKLSSILRDSLNYKIDELLKN